MGRYSIIGREPFLIVKSL